jgi:protein phosphatase
MKNSILYSARSEVGLRRLNNEDVYRVDLNRGYCLVADGMGGEAAGEVASSLFAGTASTVFQHAPSRNEDQVMMRVQETYRLANQRVRDHAIKNPDHRGLGCTAELMAFSDQGFVLGHIGDSRSYRFRNRSLKQLTLDHSLVQKQLDSGLITPEEARLHPLRNVITRAVGIEDEISLDLIRGPICRDDLFLMCSDGLTDLVDDERIAAALSADAHLDGKVDSLIDAALKAGGSDNITVVLLGITAPTW